MFGIRFNGDKFFSWIFLLFVIPYTLGVIYMSLAIKDNLDKEYIQRVDILADKVHFMLDDGVLSPAYNALSQAALSEDILKLADAVGNRTISGADQMGGASLQQLVVFYQAYSSIIAGIDIGTEQGGYLSYPDYHMERGYDPRSQMWYRDALKHQGQPSLAASFLREDNKNPTLAVVHTIDRDGNTAGVISVGLNLQSFQQSVEKMRIGSGGFFMVLDPNDRIIVSPLHPEWLFKTPGELLLADLLNFRERPAGQHLVNLDGKNQYMRVNVSPKTGWAALSLVDVKEWRQQTYPALWVVFGVYCLTLLCILAIIMAIARHISRPVHELSQAAFAITSGDLNTQVIINSNDEFGFLADSFNQMADKLRENFAEIQRQTEEIRKREREFQSLIENAQDIILRLDKSLRYLYVNPAIETYIGVSARSFGGKNNWELGFPAEFCQPLETCCHKVFRTGRDRFLEMEFTAYSGENVFFQAHVIPEFDSFGRVKTVLSVMRNVTERKRLEKQMVHLDRLNLVGEMAAGIAHEVRNPMTTVRGYLQMIDRKDPNSQYHEHFLLMIEELDRANGILTEFLSLAKNKRVDLRITNLNDIIKSLQPLIQADAYMSRKAVVWELSDIPPITLDEKEIRQMILNMARNGLEAMAAGGCLTIRTYAEGEEVFLVIRDQGPGISPDILNKIGLPFMTTKDNGTGLGLAVCYSIAARHKARIDIQTSERGAVFSVVFNRQFVSPS